MRLSTPTAVLVLLALRVPLATASPIDSCVPEFVDGRIAGLDDSPAAMGAASANFPDSYSWNFAFRLAVLAGNRATSFARDLYEEVAGLWAGQYPPSNEVPSDPFQIFLEVPEPSSPLLPGLGLVLIWIGVWRRRAGAAQTGRNNLGK